MIEKKTLKEFLDKNSIINKAALAALMYPDVPKTAKTRLSNKMAKVSNGKSTQRILNKDLDAAKSVLGDLAKKIIDFNANATID